MRPGVHLCSALSHPAHPSPPLPLRSAPRTAALPPLAPSHTYVAPGLPTDPCPPTYLPTKLPPPTRISSPPAPSPAGTRAARYIGPSPGRRPVPPLSRPPLHAVVPALCLCRCCIFSHPPLLLCDTFTFAVGFFPFLLLHTTLCPQAAFFVFPGPLPPYDSSVFFFSVLLLLLSACQLNPPQSHRLRLPRCSPTYTRNLSSTHLSQ